VGRTDEAALEVTEWLKEQDIHAFIVEADKVTEAALQNTRAAFDRVRARAAEWQAKMNAVGVMALDEQDTATAPAVSADADFTNLSSS